MSLSSRLRDKTRSRKAVGNIYVTAEQDDFLQELAAEFNCGKAEIIRTIIEWAEEQYRKEEGGP